MTSEAALVMPIRKGWLKEDIVAIPAKICMDRTLEIGAHRWLDAERDL